MASYEVVNNIGVITCQNPPVNALSYHLRKDFINGMKSALSDSNVKAIVIIADGRTFIAGADITEFSKPPKPDASVTEMLDILDKSTKPTVAAIHGTALGGGFEVALTCHYRLGTSRCKVGLPEVLIGLLPGAGGTQRLPRLIGPMLAAEMICSGQHVRANVAYSRGILDELIPIQDNHKLSMERLILRTRAIRFALSVADKPIKDRIISNRACKKMDAMFYEQLAMMSAKKARGYLAPQLCLKAVRAAQESASFEEGMKKERDLFIKLLTNPQSRALQNVFFAQRECAKIPGLKVKELAKPIRKVGIIGCGTMGGGICMCFAEKGVSVTVLETKQQYLDKGMNVIESNWKRQVKKGRLSPNKYEKYISLITPTLSYNDLSDCDIVIEAVFENLRVKQEVFKKLDSVCKRECILASNTSFIPIEEIAKVTSRPNQVIGTHFFAPANKMQLLENVRFDGGADDVTCATVQAMAKQIGKKGVLVRSCPGFVGNRMFKLETSEAMVMILEGASPSEIDAVCYDDVGCAMGVIAVMDLSGLDIGYDARKESGIKDPKYAIGDALVESGRRGLKTGKGLYDYPGLPRSRKGVPSKFVQGVIEKIAKEQGVQRRKISKKEILERLFYPMINEGFNILNEGVALRPSDIDVVLVFGYGFPPYKGGPMHWAQNEIGLKKLYKTMVKYQEKYPNVEYWKPSPLLKACVDSKMSLAKYLKKNKTSKL